MAAVEDWAPLSRALTTVSLSLSLAKYRRLGGTTTSAMYWQRLRERESVHAKVTWTMRSMWPQASPWTLT